MKQTLQASGRETTSLEKMPKREVVVVDPLVMHRNLFKAKREDSMQEETRQLILRAFEEVKKESRYARRFRIMMPEQTLGFKNVRELRYLASEMGGYIADWVEQALGWAQLIHNGQSWEDICNKPDMANCYRLVRWKNGGYRLVGGSQLDNCNNPASYVSEFSLNENCYLTFAVPLIKKYE